MASVEDSRNRILEKLMPAMASTAASVLIDELVEKERLHAVLALMNELEDLSRKVALGAVEALPECRRRGVFAHVVEWLDLGIALTESSGAAAMKYFKESPVIMSLIETETARRSVLAVALELAEKNPNLALDFLRAAPELLHTISSSQLSEWALVGGDLGEWDYALGIEFFRHSPAVARVISIDHLRAWVGLGMKLMTRNSLGKPDYLGTLEFFRTSSHLFGAIDAGIRKQVIDLGSVLAERDPSTAVVFIGEAPALLRRLPTHEWRAQVVAYNIFIAERDPQCALEYIRRCPEFVSLVEPSPEAPSQFEAWFKEGMEVLGYSPEGARAYFALETNKALKALEHAMSGVSLRHVARSLKLFAEALCGVDISIRPLPDSFDQTGKASVRARVSPDGRTISLPALLRRYPNVQQNLQLYTAMTAHEAGHVEFGTFAVRFDGLADVIVDARQRYGRDEGSIHTLADMFELYPHPALMRDLWMILEDARVEFRLRLEYSGLGQDLAVLAREAAETRSLLHGASVREMAVDCLLLLSTQEPGTVRIPDAIRDVVSRAWAELQTVLTPAASADTAIRMAHRLYILLEAATGTVAQTDQAADESAADVGLGPQASEETAGVYQPVTNWTYRGEMNPDLVKNLGGSGEDAAAMRADAGQTETGFAGPDPLLQHAETSDAPARDRELRKNLSENTPPNPNSHPSAAAKRLLDLGDDRLEGRTLCEEVASASYYDEWDALIQDYRTGWCRVTERTAPEGDLDFVETVLANHRPAVRLLRRYFESLRPPGLRRVFGQQDGEEVDLDAAIARSVDHKAGAAASDRMYVRRDKRERDVAVAILVDVSGSTSRQIAGAGRRVIDVEKEGLVLLSEALDAIGDQYAVYGYSGQGRRAVDFWILKDFDEPFRRAARRLGSVDPLQQNRDGAAIRHAARKLLRRETRKRLLIVISDGRPLDDGYAGEYALGDTKMALQEATRRGIDSFCITVDRQADEYARHMYGDIRFVIIDRIECLPERLPRVYHRLTA